MLKEKLREVAARIDAIDVELTRLADDAMGVWPHAEDAIKDTQDALTRADIADKLRSIAQSLEG